MAVPIPPLHLTGGAGGNAGPSEAGGMLDNPFATGEMAVSYGGNASTAASLNMWALAGAALVGLWLWKRSK